MKSFERESNRVFVLRPSNLRASAAARDVFSARRRLQALVSAPGRRFERRSLPFRQAVPAPGNQDGPPRMRNAGHSPLRLDLMASEELIGHVNHRVKRRPIAMGPAAA